MPSPLRSRFLHLDLEVDLDDWCKWAAAANIDPMVIGFVRFRPELLHKFDKKERSFPCPRTWEFVNKAVKKGPPPAVEHELFAGLVGEGAAIEFSAFKRLYKELPSLDLVIATPKTAPVPTSPAALYAVSAGLARKATLKNFGAILTYLDRLPQVEFAVSAVKDAVARAAELAQSAAFVAFQAKHQDVTFA
jgi:hypothetical protein